MTQPAPQSLIASLDALVAEDAPDAVALGELVELMGARAFGAGLFALALPCAPPFLYVVPQIVAVPMLLLAMQLACGRAAPWLPASWRMKRVEKAALATALGRARPLLKLLERLVRPRFASMTGRMGARIAGAFMTIFAGAVLIPLPGTNTVPGIAVAVAAFGLAERDGVLTLLGLVLGSVWIALLLVGGGAAATALLRSVLG